MHFGGNSTSVQDETSVVGAGETAPARRTCARSSGTLARTGQFPGLRTFCRYGRVARRFLGRYFSLRAACLGIHGLGIIALGGIQILLLKCLEVIGISSRDLEVLFRNFGPRSITPLPRVLNIVSTHPNRREASQQKIDQKWKYWAPHLIILACLASPRAALAIQLGESLKFVCKENQQADDCNTGLPTCAQVIAGSGTDLPGVLPAFKNQMSDRIDKYYKRAKDMGIPVCNLLNKIANRDRCTDSDSSWGDSFIGVGQDYWFEGSWSEQAVLLESWWKPKRVDIRLHGGAGSGVKGGRESSFFHGSWTAAIECHAQQVQQEIEANRAIKITDATCLQIAQEFDKLRQESSEALKIFEGGYCNSQIDWGSVCRCDHNLASGQGMGVGCTPDKLADTIKLGVEHRQAACYLHSAALGLNIGIARVAECEAVARANKKWQEKFILGDTLPINDIKSAIDAKLAAAVEAQKTQCANDHPFSEDGFDWLAQRRECIRTAVTGQYRQEFETFILDRTKESFDLGGAQCRP